MHAFTFDLSSRKCTKWLFFFIFLVFIFFIHVMPMPVMVLNILWVALLWKEFKSEASKALFNFFPFLPCFGFRLLFQFYCFLAFFLVLFCCIDECLFISEMQGMIEQTGTSELLSGGKMTWSYNGNLSDAFCFINFCFLVLVFTFNRA